jgi:hypothetical protein
MAKYRPTGVLVIAILHLIGGGLGLLFALFSLVMLALGANQMFGTPPPPPPPPPNATPQQKEQFERLMKFQKDMTDLGKNPPGGPAYQYGVGVADLLLSAMMVAAGIGLIVMQPWARTLSIVYAALSILKHLGDLVYAFGFLLPAFNAVLATAPKDDPFLGTFSTFMSLGLMVGTIITFLFIIYPIIVLIIMLKPSTAAAFRGEYVDPFESRPPMDYAEPFRAEPDDRYRRGDE